MMHENITLSDKVIIIISKGYKEKAEKFIGGVGREYKYILSLIDKEPKKIIIISFQELNSNTFRDCVPLAFNSRDIVDITADEKNEFRKLFSKLLDKGQIDLSPVTNELPTLEVKSIPIFTVAKRNSIKPHAKNHEIEAAINELAGKIINDSYFERYECKIDCEYVVVNGKLAVKKKVHSKIKLVNPLENHLEEANFFTTYLFSAINGIEPKNLLKLLLLKVKVDNDPEVDLTPSIVIDISTNRKDNPYRNPVSFSYQRNEGGYLNSLIVPFKKEIEIELREERIVPRNDLVYVKELNKLTKTFRIDYSFNDLQGSLNGNFVRSLAKREKISSTSSQNGKKFTIITDDWLIPGDGIFIYVESNE